MDVAVVESRSKGLFKGVFKRKHISAAVQQHQSGSGNIKTYMYV